MARLTTKLLFYALLAFGLWYLLTKTELGSGFSRDVIKMSGFVSTNTSEGLRSAQNVTGRLF